MEHGKPKFYPVNVFSTSLVVVLCNLFYISFEIADIIFIEAVAVAAIAISIVFRSLVILITLITNQ